MESFVQRFNRLEAQRETGNELIKVCLFAAEAVILFQRQRKELVILSRIYLRISSFISKRSRMACDMKMSVLQKNWRMPIWIWTIRGSLEENCKYTGLEPINT